MAKNGNSPKPIIFISLTVQIVLQTGPLSAHCPYNKQPSGFSCAPLILT